MKPHYLVLAALALMGALLGGTSAWANVAANTQIINQATLSYNDGTGVKTSTTAVTVTVALVPAAPVIIPGPPQTTTYNGSTTTLTDSYIIVAGANGPDSYTLAGAVGTTSNTTSPTATATSPTVYLGATVTTTGSTTTNLIVPADGVSDGSVNGIQTGDMVVVNGETRQVANVIDNTNGTSTIVLSTPLSTAPTAGVLVAEQKTITVNTTAGTIQTIGTDVTVNTTLTATSTTDPTKTITSGPVLNTFTSGTATLTKYVRNVTAANGTGTPYVYSSTNYYQTGVTGKPGDTLEYILVATNSGTGPVTAAVVTDVLPTTYVALKAGAYGVGREVTYVNEASAASTLSAAVDTDAASYDGTSTLSVNVGTGATNLAGGSIPATTSVHVLYQVTINP